MRRKSAYVLAEKASEIQLNEALEANFVGYVAKIFANTSLPCKKPIKNTFCRQNGGLKVYLCAPDDIGLPYGAFPRLLLSEIVTQVRLTGSQDVFLGRSVSDLLRRMGKKSSGGKNGSLTTYRQQTQRLLSTSFNVIFESEHRFEIDNFNVAGQASMLWEPSESSSSGLRISISDEFYEDILISSFPVDKRVLYALSNYPLAIDVYCWLTYRFSFLRSPTFVSWLQLKEQFGSDISTMSNFKRKFSRAIYRVSILYPAGQCYPEDRGVKLYPSPTHIPR